MRNLIIGSAMANRRLIRLIEFDLPRLDAVCPRRAKGVSHQGRHICLPMRRGVGALSDRASQRASGAQEPVHRVFVALTRGGSGSGSPGTSDRVGRRRR